MDFDLEWFKNNVEPGDWVKFEISEHQASYAGIHLDEFIGFEKLGNYDCVRFQERVWMIVSIKKVLELRRWNGPSIKFKKKKNGEIDRVIVP